MMDSGGAPPVHSASRSRGTAAELASGAIARAVKTPPRERNPYFWEDAFTERIHESDAARETGTTAVENQCGPNYLGSSDFILWRLSARNSLVRELRRASWRSSRYRAQVLF